MDHLSNSEVAAAGLADWRKLAQALHARFLVPDYAAAARFTAAVAEVADAGGHRPDLRVGAGFVDVTACTREDGRWVTRRDVDFAAAVSERAREHGLVADPTAVTQLELALDTAYDPARTPTVGPFWSALLTGSPGNQVHDTVFDPTDRVPSLWFQRSDPPGSSRQTWHFDLWLAPEIAVERIAAAVAAGGVVVHEREAPAFTLLADPDGNQVCVCTSLGR